MPTSKAELAARSRAYYWANVEACRERARLRAAETRATAPDVVRAYKRAQRLLHLEEARASARARRLANLERERARARAWGAAHAELVRLKVKAWRAAHPAEVKAATHAQNMKRRAACFTQVANPPTPAQLRALLKDPCLYCGAPAEHVDHFIPLSRGGTHDLDNLVAACKACNLSKGAKLPDVEWKGRF